MRDTRPLTCFPGFRPLILTFVVLVAAFVVVLVVVFFCFFAMSVSSRLGPLKSFKVFGPFRRVPSGVLIDCRLFGGAPAWGRCAAKLADRSLPAPTACRDMSRNRRHRLSASKSVVRGAISAQRLPSMQMAGSS